MSDASTISVRMPPPVPQLTYDLHLDHSGEWVAQIRGHDGCIGDGHTKQEAIEAALSLFLHVLILRIQRGEWGPMWRPLNGV